MYYVSKVELFVKVRLCSPNVSGIVSKVKNVKLCY